MPGAQTWITIYIDAIGYFGLVVFAVSGALAAARHRMDPIGFILLGAITAIGGGTVRDLLLGRPVFWVEEPYQILLPAFVALLTYFFVPGDVARQKGMIWSDALGLAAFAVQGAQIALSEGARPAIVIIMGVTTAVGGGLLRDVLCGERPYIVQGDLYASTALAGASAHLVLVNLGVAAPWSMLVGFMLVFTLRAWAIISHIQLGWYRSKAGL